MSNYIKSGLSQMRFKEETTPGTYNAPQAADNDIILYYDGFYSNETVSESIGTLADGTYKTGQSYVREKMIGLPEFKTEMRKAAAATTAPKWTKLALSASYTEYEKPTTLEKGVYWNGQPSCKKLSCLLEQYRCGTSPTGQSHQIRGMAGNMEIKFDSPSSPIELVFSNWKGAWPGPVERSAAVVDPVTGNDTAFTEVSGKYDNSTIGGFDVDVWAYSFNPNCNAEMVPGSNDEGIAFFDAIPQDNSLKITVPVEAIGDKDYISEYFGGTIQNIVVDGTSSGYLFQHNDCSFIGVSPTEVNGQSAYELEFNILTDAWWVQK